MHSFIARRIPRQLIYILRWFIVTRFILMVIGVLSFILLYPLVSDHFVWHYEKSLLLDIWGAWDTGFYLDIAENWYETDVGLGSDSIQSNLGFFPLYPMLVRIFRFVIGDYFVAGLIVSNIALIIASYYMYLLAQRLFNKRFARSAIVYLFLFPASFVLSSVLAESLFVIF